MPGTKEGSIKTIATMIEKYGSEEAYRAKKREWAAKGGKRKVRKGFAVRHELSSPMGRKGGLVKKG